MAASGTLLKNMKFAGVYPENENAKIVLNPKFPFFGAKSVLIGNP
jgi:hypothetical protein